MKNMKGELESMRIESAENGLMVTCYWKHGKLMEPENYVYPDVPSAMKKIGSEISGMKGAKRSKGGVSLSGVGAGPAPSAAPSRAGAGHAWH